MNDTLLQNKTLVFSSLIARLSVVPLAERLTPIWVSLGLLFVLLSKGLDFGAMGASLSGLPAWGFGLVVAGLTLSWGALVGRHVGAVLRAPGMWPFWRLGVGGSVWGMACVPCLLMANAVPALLLLGLRQPVSLVLLMFGVGQAALTAIGVGRPALALVAALSGGLLAALAHEVGALWPVVGSVALISGVFFGGRLYTAARAPLARAVPGFSVGQPQRPWSALLVRDLRCLWRLERRLFAMVGALMAFTALVSWRVHTQSHDAAMATRVMMIFASGLGGVFITRLCERLAPLRQLDSPRWPVRVTTRAWTLCLIAFAPVGAVGLAGWALYGWSGAADAFMMLTLGLSLSVVWTWSALVAPKRQAALPAALNACLAAILVTLGPWPLAVGCHASMILVGGWRLWRHLQTNRETAP